VKLEMRRYIRHPSDIPIEFNVEGGDEEHLKDSLNDVSFGGLSFNSRQNIPLGSQVFITISFVDPPFQSFAKVKWCAKQGDGFVVGVSFNDPEDAYRARMIEQICYIEHYKREVLERDGRNLTGEEAASEWITLYADKFPKIDLHT